MMTKEKFLKVYGFYDDIKYVLPGSEIMKYIGQKILKIKFEKKGGTWIDTEQEVVKVLEISEYDPITISYVCKYEDKDGNKEETRIIPEGFSSDPDLDNTGFFYKFTPFSIQAKFNEDEIFYMHRLPELYKTKETAPTKLLETIGKDKCQAEVLRYSHNFGMICKVDIDEEMYAWVRITKLSITHKSGDTYYLTLQNEKDKWNMTIKSGDKEYNLPGIGIFKLIDLGD